MLLKDFLEQSAIKFPEKIAVKIKNEYITYKELNETANQIAHFLLSLNILKSERIGIYLPKSITSVAAIFGILKAGGVYVPLDIDSPVKRTEYIISNCNISIIISDKIRIKKLAKNLAPNDKTLILLSTDDETSIYSYKSWLIYSKKHFIQKEKDNPQYSNVLENDPAYILYTSGSTGNPKGVVLTHKNGKAFVEWAFDTLNLKSSDVFSSHAPFHFDLSVFDIYASFKAGGTLCLIPQGLSYFPDAILKYISENKITVWYSVPSALIQLLDAKKDISEDLKSIRILIYAGEVFHYKYINKLIQNLNNTQIINFYGPTETNVITYYNINLSSNQLLTENVPIGKPCSYADIRIVDENFNEVPDGKVGELIVNSSSTALGYSTPEGIYSLNNKNLIFDGIEKSYYFTGDMVFKKSDGNIYYINRIDNMIKTRGFRVELGEIESVLYQHSLVNMAVVVAVPDEKITNQLVAYVVLKDGESTTESDITAHCSNYLPFYMVPTKINFVDTMPLTSNGKIDREKLKKIYQS